MVNDFIIDIWFIEVQELFQQVWLKIDLKFLTMKGAPKKLKSQLKIELYT